MKIVCTLLLCFAIILNLIGISSQSGRSPDGANRSGSSPQPAELTARDRFPGVLGYRFEDLEFIRLRPYCSPDRVFELRTYVFPPDEPIGVRTRPGILKPMPAGEQIVLSTSDGDMWAIMDRRDKKKICFRAMYIIVSGKPKRAIMNMNTRAIKRLTDDESDECPVYSHDHIAKNFAVFRADTAIPHTESSGPSSSSSSRHFPDTSQPFATSHPLSESPKRSEPPLRERSRSPTLRQTFPTILGYRFEDLDRIRLSPHNYPHRIFELRIYVFPTNKPIGIITRHHILNPMPTGDQVVLSTSNGDVHAILLRQMIRSPSLRPMFISNLGNLERVKINMNNGEIVALSNEENAECPVTFTQGIKKFYKVYHV